MTEDSLKDDVPFGPKDPPQVQSAQRHSGSHGEAASLGLLVTLVQSCLPSLNSQLFMSR